MIPHDEPEYSQAELADISALADGSLEASRREAVLARIDEEPRMRELFERAQYLLPLPPDPAQSERVRGLFREIGSESMRENAEWVAIYRQRPLRPHS